MSTSSKHALLNSIYIGESWCLPLIYYYTKNQTKGHLSTLIDYFHFFSNNLNIYILPSLSCIKKLLQEVF